MYHLFASSDGQLLPDASKDGIHLLSAANQKMMEYVKTHAIPSKNTASTLIGDVNRDGKIDSRDTVLLSQFLAEWDVNPDIKAADCSGDGLINAKDNVLLMQYIAGWDVELR